MYVCMYVCTYLCIIYLYIFMMVSFPCLLWPMDLLHVCSMYCSTWRASALIEMFFWVFQVFGKILSLFYLLCWKFKKIQSKQNWEPPKKSNVIHMKDFCVKDVPRGLTRLQISFIYNIFFGFWNCHMFQDIAKNIAKILTIFHFPLENCSQNWLIPLVVSLIWQRVNRINLH
jgi:hypothetical protein